MVPLYILDNGSLGLFDLGQRAERLLKSHPFLA